MTEKLNKIQETLPELILRALEGGRDSIIRVLKARIKSGKKSGGQPFSPYSESHSKRRSNKGLQTSFKDMTFSGTMLDSFKEISRSSTVTSAEIKIGFTGNANRRKDQKATSNEQVAMWLSEQENYKIVELSDTEKEQIKKEIISKFKGELGEISIT